tara:strand:- start:23350 stop:24252 length:903 start_codon:yes stop_codon:yes gene_type:complete
MARKVLSEHNKIRLPAYQLPLSDKDTRLQETYTVTPERSITFEQVSFPDKQISPHYDTAILNIKGHSLRLRLYFDAASSPITEGRTTPTLAINISSLESAFNQGKSNFKEATENALLENTTNKRWLYHPREEHARRQFMTAIAEAREKMASTGFPISAQAGEEVFDDILALHRHRMTPPATQPIRNIDTQDPSERLRRYWRKLEKGMIIHVPNPAGGDRVVALHSMELGYTQESVVIQAVCTRHKNTFNLHLSIHALTDFPTDTLDRLSQLNRPTLLICFGNRGKPFECMWVNQPTGYAI